MRGLVLNNPTALAQSASSYIDPDNGISFYGITDPVHSITYGYILPPIGSTTNPNEFIGEIVAPIATEWAGVSPGGAMVDMLLLVAWPNGNAIVRSPRYATYVAASLGPIMSDLVSYSDYIQPV